MLYFSGSNFKILYKKTEKFYFLINVYSGIQVMILASPLSTHIQLRYSAMLLFKKKLIQTRKKKKKKKVKEGRTEALTD